MRNIDSILLVIACVWSSMATASPSSRGRKLRLRKCENYDLQQCKQHANLCKVIQRDGLKNLCADIDTYESCRYVEIEADCWANTDCIWKTGICEAKSTISNSTFCVVGNGNLDCVGADEICVAFPFLPNPCLDSNLGQCLPRPNDCPSSTEKVCGCDGKTYNNECESWAAGENVKYVGTCSATADRTFRRDANIDDCGQYTNELIKQYTYSSLSTGGSACLTELECKKQSQVINGNSMFVTIEDPDSCGCFELDGYSFWSDHNSCTTEKMRTKNLIGSRTRTYCDLNRIYQRIGNVPYDTCLSEAECDDQCGNDLRIKKNNSDLCGCYTDGNKCFWNSCGSNMDKATDIAGTGYNRVWCSDRQRDVRDLVYDSCLTYEKCNAQGVLDGDVRTPPIVKEFDSESICGCYAKAGQLYWKKCGVNGDYYSGFDDVGKKRRVTCQNVGRSTRFFDRSYGQTHNHINDGLF